MVMSCASLVYLNETKRSATLSINLLSNCPQEDRMTSFQTYTTWKCNNMKSPGSVEFFILRNIKINQDLYIVFYNLRFCTTPKLLNHNINKIHILLIIFFIYSQSSLFAKSIKFTFSELFYTVCHNFVRTLWFF